LDARDQGAVQVFGYGSVAHPDSLTQRLRSKFDAYRDVVGLDDRAVAALVERDRIDILVAVAGHTMGNRVRVLAYKPAPIQVDMGSTATLGMGQVDYRLTDAILDPPEFADTCVEELVYLPGGYVSYRPSESAPAVGSLPETRNGYVTFGSFNGSQKIHPVLVSLWSRVLKAVEGSRLVMKLTGGDDPALAGHLLRLFEDAGVHRDRIRIHGWLSLARHLELYNQVDLALDTYPFNGCTTTLEGLWMGVPIVSLAGQTLTSRVGLSILSRVGLKHLAVSTVDEYVQRAVVLAENPTILAKIRSSLRPRMACSPVCDAQRYAREVEAAYRWMWRKWCDRQKPEARSENTELRTQYSELSRQGGIGG